MNTQPPSSPWRQAAAGTANRLSRKLPTVVLIAIACVGLYHLGEMKGFHDRGVKAPIVLDQRYMEKLEAHICARLGDDCQKVTVWQNLQKEIGAMKSRRFVSGEQFVTALQEQILVRQADRSRKEVENLTPLYKARLENLISRLTELSNKPEPVQIRADLLAERKKAAEESVERIRGEYYALLAKQKEDEEGRVRLIREEADEKLSFVNNYFQPDKLEELKRLDAAELAALARTDPSARPPLLYSVAAPVLSDDSPVHVIYQIFNVALLIILVVGLVSLIGLLLRRLFFAGSADALGERAKEFLAARAATGGATSEITRAVVVSIAALGVGTAVAAAGTTINDKAERALAAVNDPAYQYKLLSRNPANGGIVPGGAGGVPGRDGRSSNPFENRNVYDSSGASTLTNNFGEGSQDQPAPQINAPVYVPEPKVYLLPIQRTYVYDRRGGSAPLQPILDLSVSSPLLTFTAPSPAPTKTPVDPQPPPTPQTATTPPTTVIVGDDPAQLARSLAATNQNLEALRRDVGDLTSALKPDGRHLGSRVKNLFSGERYLLTAQTQNLMAGLLGKAPEDALLLCALEALARAGGPPRSKDDLLKAVKAQMVAEKAAASPSSSGTLTREELRRLKAWERVLLRSTRIAH